MLLLLLLLLLLLDSFQHSKSDHGKISGLGGKMGSSFGWIQLESILSLHFDTFCRCLCLFCMYMNPAGVYKMSVSMFAYTNFIFHSDDELGASLNVG